MTQTKKFSQFNGPDPIQDGDIVVGLRVGADGLDNWQFTGVGSGGGGSGEVLEKLIQQPNHMLQPGNWVTMSPAGNYVPALADDPEDAEISGVVTADQLTPNQFTLAVVGFIEDGVFTDLVPGDVYFLSDVTPGLMQLTEPTTNGHVSIPVFIAVTPTQGWIRQWRGFILGGQPSPQGGGGPVVNPSIVMINQPSHGLTKGQVVRLSGSITYVPAQGDSLSHSQGVGIVIQVIDPNNFVLQTEGYNVGAISQDDLTNPLVPGTVYYISPTVAGSVSSTNPASVGQSSKPMFVCEQTALSSPTGVNAGYILPQRPIQIEAANVNPNIVTINQVGHGLSVGNWVYISGSLTYTAGIATSLAASQVVGVVIDVIDANNFILQTEGYNVGAVTQDDAANPIVPSDIYYLSSTVAGAITAVEPASAGLFTKPLFSCEQTFGVSGVNAGYVLEQRPLPFTSTSNPSVVTVNQPGHGLSLGDVIRVSNTGTLVKAQGDNLADAQAIGVVTEVIDPNNFVLQTEGFVTDAITQDDGGSQLVEGTPYYLSPTVAGKVTSVPPSGIGEATKPIFIPKITSPGHATGFILPQRPLPVTAATSNPNIVTVTQTAHGFSAGQWVYISGFSGVNPTYSLGIATSLTTSQVVGVVINVIDANHFTLQTEGYNLGAVTTDDLGNPILQSLVYYLSPIVAGAITSIAPTIIGQFTKPLYASEQTIASTGATAGYILEQRPLQEVATSNPSIVTINQVGHGLNLGDVVRLNGSVTYVRAISTTLANAQAVGVVIMVINANSFVLQTEGYSSGAITLDDTGSALVAAAVYYLSPTVAGKVTSTIPATVGQATKPIFICEQAGGTPAGYIVPQRPLPIVANSTNVNIVTVTQPGHGFSVGNWVYISGFAGANPVYTRGIATSLATSQVVGVVIQVISSSQFVLQTEGYNVGAVTTDASGNPIVQSNIYYLSPVTAGMITATAPSTIGQFTKPLYASEQTTASTGINTGYVLPQRPLAVSGGGGGGGGYQLIANIPVTNSGSVPIFGLFAGFKDIRIVGESFIFRQLSSGTLSAQYFGMQLQLGGILKSSNFDYPQPQAGAPSTTSSWPAFNGILIAQASSIAIDTSVNKAFNFTLEFLGINNSTYYKLGNLTTISPFPNSSGVSPTAAFYNQSASLCVTSTGALTGISFSFYQPGLYVIQSGLISVYGVPI
jgi:hypothetical protein